MGKKELTLKEKQDIMLDIMIDIDCFCRENNIRYSLACGTLLGAVRHGGFIPWDDDADLFMLREDFDRFVSTYKSDRFHLLYNTRKDDEFFAMGYAKVNDPTTYIAETLTMTNHGVFVDIFPLDRVPVDPKEQHRHMHRILSCHNRIHHRQHKDLLSIIKSYRHSLDWWINRLDTIVRDPAVQDSPLVAHAIGTTNYRLVLNRDIFDTLTEIPFEGHNFFAFKDTDTYLTKDFGPDYMTPKKYTHNMKVYRKDEQ